MINSIIIQSIIIMARDLGFQGNFLSLVFYLLFSYYINIDLLLCSISQREKDWLPCILLVVTLMDLVVPSLHLPAKEEPY